MRLLRSRSRPALVPRRVRHGFDGGRVATEGARVIAVDLRREGLERLHGLHRSAWPTVASSTHLPVASRVIDAALALDVLEHTDDLASVREIERVLKPGGFVVVMVPALPWLWSARDVEAGHRRRYTRRALSALLDRAGLEVVELRFYRCLLPPLPIATSSGKRWRRRRPWRSSRDG
jgi:SAM-dependent methyltransferase